MRIPTVVLLVFALLACTAATAADDGFPGRKEHPEVPVLELADLHSRFNDVVLVDARSHYEFDTLRIKGAVNIPVAEKSFEQQVAELRASTDKPIVFYCNGMPQDTPCMNLYFHCEGGITQRFPCDYFICTYDDGKVVKQTAPCGLESECGKDMVWKDRM